MSVPKESLLRELRKREAIRNKCYLNVSFPPESKETLIGLGGYLKLSKSSEKNLLKGRLIFASEEDAVRTKQIILAAKDEAIKVEPADINLPEDRINWTSLKLNRVPKSVSDDDIVSLFSGAISIIRKPERRVNLIWSSRNKFQNEVARDEVIVGFPSKELSIKRFMASDDLHLGGEQIIVLFGQKNVKIPKSKRKKLRQLRSQLKQERKEKRKVNKLKMTKNPQGSRVKSSVSK